MSSPRMIVVGGGVYGWGIALRATELGVAVTVLDPRDVGDVDRGSGGVSRLLRLEYGTAAHYSELALKARSRWREIETESGADLYREVGALFIVPEGDSGAWEEASLEATAAIGHPGERLSAEAVTERWPAIRAGGIAWAIANPTGGYLRANRATQVLAGLAQARGAVFRREHVVAVAADGATVSSGERVHGDLVVMATGSWSRAVEPTLPITPARQVTAYLRGGPRNVPIFAEGAPFAMYGTPGHDAYGLKVGSHITGPDRDPDDPRQRVATEDDLAALREYAGQRFGLTGEDAKIVRADVCFYDMTVAEDPVIDWLPDGRFVCAGFSGHGFKFAPVLSAAAAEGALGREPSVDLTPFRLR